MSKIVGNKSIEIVGMSLSLPGDVTPGQYTISGTRTPPS
jgi:hypothetical protein